jgi:hypothetical protein
MNTRFAFPFGAALFLCAVTSSAARAQATDPDPVPDTLQDLKTGDNPLTDGFSAGGHQAVFGQGTLTEPNNPQPGYHDHGRGGNTFVNDPCLDPPPPNRQRTVQSETEIAVFGLKYMVAGYNNSRGFYNNSEGLSGFAYSINGGNTWIDGGGLPPLIPGAPAGTPGHDSYFGDPVLVVDPLARTFPGQPAQAAGQFYYSSIYQLPDGTFSLAVNRGRFQVAPPTTPESESNTRCVNNPALQGVPDTSKLPAERIVWERPSIAVPVTDPGALLDKEWLYVNPDTGKLYLAYVRFGSDGATPLELVRSDDGGHTWKGPFVIVPNLDDTFNTGVQPMVTSTGRVVVSYLARKFSNGGFGPEVENRVEVATSDTDGVTFNPPVVVNIVNPQGEPLGYNRGRFNILNAPYIAPETDGTNVYITYFSGKTVLPVPTGVQLAKMADIFVSTSHDNGNTWTSTKANDDPGTTSHVFPSVQVNKHGFVYTGWQDRRTDPANVITDTFAAVSKNSGLSFSPNREQSDVGTSWFARADAAPNFGDYNSSELLGDNQFVLIWADGRFPPPAPAPGAATPDVIFTIANGLGN